MSAVGTSCPRRELQLTVPDSPAKPPFSPIRVAFKHTNLPSKGSAETELLRAFYTVDFHSRSVGNRARGNARCDAVNCYNQ
jgi:hypothetical protein